jgi:beta-glucanase (GH16 family)
MDNTPRLEEFLIRPVRSAAGFHTFAISRTGSSIKWYVDRVQYAEANISGGINSTSEFQGHSSSSSTSPLAETLSAVPTAALCFRSRCRLIG